MQSTQSFLKTAIFMSTGPARLPLPGVREKMVRWAQRGMLTNLAETVHPTYRTALLDEWLSLVGTPRETVVRNLRGQLRGRDEAAKLSIADTYALFRAASHQIETTRSMEMRDRSSAQRAFDAALPRGREIAGQVLEAFAREKERQREAEVRQRALKEAGLSGRAEPSKLDLLYEGIDLS